MMPLQLKEPLEISIPVFNLRFHRLTNNKLFSITAVERAPTPARAHQKCASEL